MRNVRGTCVCCNLFLVCSILNGTNHEKVCYYLLVAWSFFKVQGVAVSRRQLSVNSDQDEGRHTITDVDVMRRV